MIEIPVLKQGKTLIASVQTAVSDHAFLELQERLARDAGTSRITGVIIDVTAQDVIDSFSVRVLKSIAEVLRLRGVRTVIVGIQPEVAVAMVRLGLAFGDTETALDLEDGLALLQRPEKGRRSAPWQTPRPRQAAAS